MSLIKMVTRAHYYLLVTCSLWQYILYSEPIECCQYRRGIFCTFVFFERILVKRANTWTNWWIRRNAWRIRVALWQTLWWGSVVGSIGLLWIWLTFHIEVHDKIPAHKQQRWGISRCFVVLRMWIREGYEHQIRNRSRHRIEITYPWYGDHPSLVPVQMLDGWNAPKCPRGCRSQCQTPCSKWSVYCEAILQNWCSYGYTWAPWADYYHGHEDVSAKNHCAITCTYHIPCTYVGYMTKQTILVRTMIKSQSVDVDVDRSHHHILRWRWQHSAPIHYSDLVVNHYHYYYHFYNHCEMCRLKDVSPAFGTIPHLCTTGIGLSDAVGRWALHQKSLLSILETVQCDTVV